MSATRVAIVGGGIAGLAAALALSGRGFAITVFERRTGFAETGAGIQLSPNASRVLAALGLEPALRRVATETQAVAVRSLASGREIGEVALGAAMRRRFGAPYWSVARADLHTVLLDAVRGRRDVALRFGRTFSSMDNGAEAVTLGIETASGARESVEADLAIGADGIGSRVRPAIGDPRPPAYSGYLAYRATLPAEALPDADLARTSGLWLGRQAHVVHYPIASGRRVNVVAIARGRDPVEGWSAPVAAQTVRAAFGRACDPLRALVAAPSEWSAWSLDELPVRLMGRGRVALIGDAAHPVLPYLAQGGALAIEDAAVLAGSLGEAREIPGAVAAYARMRLPRVRRVQQAAHRNGFAYHTSGPPAWIRDRVMARLGPDGMRERYAWLYGWTPPT